MQKFAVSLTIASLAVALNLQDDEEAVPTLINTDPVPISEADIEATENTILGGDVFLMDTAEATQNTPLGAEQEGEGDDVEEEDALEFDSLDENEDDIPDIYQRVLDQYVP